MKRFAFALAYLAMSALAGSAFLAERQNSHYHENICRPYRSDLAFSVFIGLLPPGWILAPSLTGFYEHGLQVRPLPECRGEVR